MDAALGPPEQMAENADELTPMMSQYFELCEAAERVARLCEITLTGREDSTGKYAMSGIPIDTLPFETLAVE